MRRITTTATTTTTTTTPIAASTSASQGKRTGCLVSVCARYASGLNPHSHSYLVLQPKLARHRFVNCPKRLMAGALDFSDEARMNLERELKVSSSSSNSRGSSSSSSRRGEEAEEREEEYT